MHENLLYAIGLAIVAASVFAFLAQFLRQPPILGYITAGILIGPQGLKLISHEGDVTMISELGLAFLLFIVGLEIDLKKFARSGASSGIIGLFQVVLCSALGFLVASWLGYEGLTATYIGVTLAFSSTMIVVKLLSDRGELDTLPGRISLGILLVQDVLAIFVLAGQGNINNPSFAPVILSIVMGMGLILVSFLVSRYVLPAAFRRVAKNPELMLVISIAWCFVMCGLAMKANFSIAMGALIAGVSISTFPYSHDVIVKIRSLRDFFVTLFFVSLGMQIIIESASILIAGVILSVFIVMSRILTIFPAAYALKLGSRVGILSSFSLAQSSEFSLVIATLGFGYGHISQEIVSLIAITLVLTSTASTYLVLSGHTLAKTATRILEGLGMKSSHHQEEESTGTTGGEILILGCHRVGSSLVHNLAEDGQKIRVLDFNPEVLTRLKEKGVSASYVDMSHFDALEEAGIHSASAIICTVSDDFLRGTSNLAILKFLRSRNISAPIILTATSIREALRMYDEGADFVLLPRILTAEHIERIMEHSRHGELDHLRTAEIELLKRRDEVLP
jgi:Kef-type K+ transport system membrane component KefB